MTVWCVFYPWEGELVLSSIHTSQDSAQRIAHDADVVQPWHVIERQGEQP